MALREREGPPGAPWEAPLGGALDRLTVESELLGSNPLGDPAVRPLYVYRPPGVELPARVPLPAVFMLQGYSGQLDTWLARKAFEPTIVERLEDLFRGGATPPALVVFVDAWTRWGGSQFLNSTATGRYADYICDEVVPFVEARYGAGVGAGSRAVLGHSSGGYGAMVLGMLRPDVFGALASIAGDAMFECAYLADFSRTARILRDHFGGSYAALLERLAEGERFAFERHGTPLSVYAYASAYSPDPARTGTPQLPFEPGTGRLVPDVWARWLEQDPLRMVPRYVEALRGMRRIILEAGRGDEYYLDLAAQAVSAEMARHGIDHTLTLFDGGHGGVAWRYPQIISDLVTALQESP